jgi:hypothetical protein
MSIPGVIGDSPHLATLPVPAGLPGQTTAFAAQVSAEVAEQYLAFRREYYHEEQPSLETVPPSHTEIHQAEIARLAESTLRVLPQALKSLPVLGGLLDHLEQVANIHSLSERDRTALHNMTMCFLYGMQGGIQPWYVEWLLASAHNLSRLANPEYYMEYPWDALLFKDPEALAQFDAAVAAGDTAVLEGEIDALAGTLVQVLRDPISTQVDLAFTGPDAEERRRVFNLKTTAAIAIGALLVAEEARLLFQPHESRQKPHSVLAPLPAQLSAHMLPGQDAPHLT